MNKVNEDKKGNPPSTKKRYIAPSIKIAHLQMESGIANSSVSNNVKLPAGGTLDEVWMEETKETEIFWN